MAGMPWQSLWTDKRSMQHGEQQDNVEQPMGCPMHKGRACLHSTPPIRCTPRPHACLPSAALSHPQREPLRLHKNWGMALLFFAMWDALLLFLVWWSCQHFGSPAVQQYQVRSLAKAAAKEGAMQLLPPLPAGTAVGAAPTLG